MNKRKYFSEFKKKVDYFMDVQPLPAKHGYYNYGVFIKYGKPSGVHTIDSSWDLLWDVPIPEFIESYIEPALQQYYPTFSKVIKKEVKLLPGTIKRMMRENKALDVASLVDMTETISYSIPYVIERVHSRDRRLVVNNGFERLLYYYPEDYAKQPKNIFHLMLADDLANLVLNECKCAGEYKKNFRINARYPAEQMINFFRLQKEKMNEDVVLKYNEEKEYWEWGRYNIHFPDDDVKNVCMDILNKNQGGENE